MTMRTMRVASAIPMHPRVLERVLDGFVQAVQLLLAEGYHGVPNSPYDAPVEWRPEPKGSEEWCFPHEVLERGWGDCEDMAIWLAAGYRNYGTPCRVVLVKTGRGRWHAVVEFEDGEIEDPSEYLKPKGRRHAV